MKMHIQDLWEKYQEKVQEQHFFQQVAGSRASFRHTKERCLQVEQICFSLAVCSLIFAWVVQLAFRTCQFH
jgi:hypothetical protein